MVLGVWKEDLGGFSTPKEALKMVFGMRSIRVFSQFFVGPLPWFMIKGFVTKVLEAEELNLYVP